MIYVGIDNFGALRFLSDPREYVQLIVSSNMWLLFPCCYLRAAPSAILPIQSGLSGALVCSTSVIPLRLAYFVSDLNTKFNLDQPVWLMGDCFPNLVQLLQ
jgi:hypothetical protein